MKCYLDTDVISKLSDRSDLSEFASLGASQGLQVVTSDLVPEELLATADPSQRARLAAAFLEVTQDGAFMLAHMNHQIQWGIAEFLAGKPTFAPYELYGRQAVIATLRDAANAPPQLLAAIKGKHRALAAHWDAMHASERPRLQQILQSGVPEPSLHEWIEIALSSEFASDLLTEVLGSTRKAAVSGKGSAYIDWNPICRCYVDQFALAIHRHGIQAALHSSKKGPKWHDYFHGAFVGVVDCFVTDDRRLRNALMEHLAIRTDLSCSVADLRTFTSHVCDRSLDELAAGDSPISWVPLPPVSHGHDEST